ncbi:transcription initiation factor TFIID subunit 4-like [Gadus macrocephalus]|uniref:transcription initiation factor TFIID subunit 4-like n=1 Tax=Gadus macrocephalus TaxID=80720 RepID=UPI0028CB9E3D|nr:transcription initiation factor TFIID subunit 4-like [Gadus macrocephalus]
MKCNHPPLLPALCLSLTNHSIWRRRVSRDSSNRRFCRTRERSCAKMAAGSDCLDDVFNTEVDEKVVSDLVGSLESELTGAGETSATASLQSTKKQVGNSAAAANSNVQSSRISQELAKTGVQGGVISSGSPMDGAGGTTAAAVSGMTAGPNPTKTSAVSDAATDTTDPAIGAPAAIAVKTLNGSNLVTISHIPGGVPCVPKGNALLSTTANTNNPTYLPSAHNVVASTVIAPQSSTSSVPTVTLVRPPMQTPSVSSQGAVISTSTVASVTSTQGPGAGINTLESPKTIIQTTAPISMVSAVPTGATVAVKSPTVLQNVRTSVPSSINAVPGSAAVRTIAAQVLAPRIGQQQPNAPNVQNIQLPPGMVLVRSESGQLLMIHHQTLAQMQAQSQSQSAMTPRPATPTSTPSVQLASLQAPGGSLLARQVTQNNLIKQGLGVQTSVQATTTLQRPPVLQNTVMLGGSASTPGQPLGTATTGQPGSAAPAVTQRIGPAGTPPGPTPISAETLENVKKCRNFLSTLIKLASSGKQTPETTANVKELVKNLLEGKIEPEAFTSRLYEELNSSPQPYLVPFLKRSLPALRQMTSDSTAFIHQSQLPLPCTQPSSTSAALTAMVLRPPLSTTTTASTRTPVVTLTQSPHCKAGSIAPQQQGATVRPQVTLAQPSLVALRGQPQPRVIMSQPQVVKQLQGSVPVVKQPLASGTRGVLSAHSALTAAQRNKLKEGGGGTYRDDDDINDVASMAGVDLSEESARILATNSDLVGTVTRSCKDQPFLTTTLLTRRVLEMGRKFGVFDLGQEVINYISHATKQRLQNLLEKVSEVAQQKNLTFKEDERFEQVTDVRTQLKFFEQLDQMEKQRKEEQEREILMKAAKSRSRQEDPEQLRLKQKAKEMQQQELAQIRQREANLTALAAIGPRKKRKMGSPANGAVAEGSGSGAAQPGGSNGGGSRQFTRQRITRVNLRDLLFCLENERESGHSHLLYKGLLK